MKTQTHQREQAEARPNPTHAVKLRVTLSDDTSKFERIGVAWRRDDGSLYVKLGGTQIVSDGFYIFPVETKDKR